MIQPSSMIKSSITRPPTSSARTTAVYLRFGAPCSTRRFRHSSGSTLANRFLGGVRECICFLFLAAQSCREDADEDSEIGEHRSLRDAARTTDLPVDCEQANDEADVREEH